MANPQVVQETPVDSIAWTGQMLAGFLQGRFTPIRRMVDPETKAKLLERYTRSLREIEVAKSQLQSEKVETYGQIKAQLLASSAEGLAALAEAAKAGAMGAQAASEMQKVFLEKDSAYLAAAANRIPDPKAMDVVGDTARAAYTAGTTIQPEEFRQRLDQAWHGEEYNDADAYQGIADVLDSAGIGEQLRNTNAVLNDPALPATSPTRYWTAHDAEEQARDAVHGVLEQKERELLAGLPEDQRAASKGMLTRYADQYVDQQIKPYLTGAIDPNTAKAAEDENQRANDILQEREAKTWEIAKRYGIPREALKRFYDIQDETHALVKDPGTFAREIEKMPYPASMDRARDRIEAEMDRLLTGEPDPLEEAIGKMATAVPNFATWAGAMRFPGLERAAIYAARHPNELVQFNRWQDADPGLVLEPDKLREKIRVWGVEQQKAGGEVGYYTRRTERLFGTRIAGKTPVEKAGPQGPTGPAAPNLDGVPEAPDKEGAPGAETRGTPAGKAVPTDEERALELPVYDLTGATRRPVASPYLDTSQPSRVLDMGDGYVYQELQDGTFVILDSPAGDGGQKIAPGDPHWMAINQDVIEWHGAFNASDMANLPQGHGVLVTLDGWPAAGGSRAASPARAPAATRPVVHPAPARAPAPASAPPAVLSPGTPVPPTTPPTWAQVTKELEAQTNPEFLPILKQWLQRRESAGLPADTATVDDAVEFAHAYFAARDQGEDLPPAAWTKRKPERTQGDLTLEAHLADMKRAAANASKPLRPPKPPPAVLLDGGEPAELDLEDAPEEDEDADPGVYLLPNATGKAAPAKPAAAEKAKGLVRPLSALASRARSWGGGDDTPPEARDTESDDA